MARARGMLPGFLLFLLVGVACAMLVRMATLDDGGGGHDHGGAPESRRADPVLYEIGNAACPVLGKVVDSRVPLAVLEGVGISLCCPSCEVDIRKDPAGTMKKLLKEAKGGAGLKTFLDDHPEIKKRLGLSRRGTHRHHLFAKPGNHSLRLLGVRA